MAGLYIHIPFCKSRCIYCGFYSTVGLTSLSDKYIDCILKELSMRTAVNKGPIKEDVSTIYIGGGTPSLLSSAQLNRLVAELYNSQIVNAENLKEFTIECNPDDITLDYAKTLQSLGINRLSMGVQTFSDDRLKFVHRRHDSRQIHVAVDYLHKVGIENISIDLMFGFPGETNAEWTNDIDQALGLGVEHISAYSLMYEEGTPLYRLLENGNIKAIDDEVSHEMYEILIDKLEASGYEHYEISNFAKSGYRSVHNSSYWHDIPYIGIGASAHSYDKLTRQWNVSNIKEYIHSIETDVIPCEKETIDVSIHYNDIITTALRTKEGIDLSTIDESYKEYLLLNAKKSILNGNLALENNHLHLTRQAIFISDDIMSDLILA